MGVSKPWYGRRPAFVAVTMDTPEQVKAFLDGQTAESIAQSFPVLTLEQVYGDEIEKQIVIWQEKEKLKGKQGE